MQSDSVRPCCTPFPIWICQLFHVLFNCYFFICTQVSQEASKVVWYSHLLKNFPQFVVIHTVKCFHVVSESEVGIVLEFLCFFHDPVNVIQFDLQFLCFFETQFVRLEIISLRATRLLIFYKMHIKVLPLFLFKMEITLSHSCWLQFSNISNIILYVFLWELVDVALLSNGILN